MGWNELSDPDMRTANVPVTSGAQPSFQKCGGGGGGGECLELDLFFFS